MKRFKHILAPTDLSPESLSTVRYAIHLARAQEAKLTILHVPQKAALMLTGYPFAVDLAALDQEVENSARHKLEKWARTHLKSDVKASLVVRGGITDETICSVASETGASLIVMATHGRKGLGHVIVGSVTERVLRDAPCPVLVVRPPEPVITTKKAA